VKETKLLYLHGFNSSPESFKAQAMMAYMRQHGCESKLICPQLPTVPGEAKVYLDQLVTASLPDASLAYVGSSLGGYYATYLAETYGGTAVLVNPSVRPYVTLEACLGENRFYHDDICWMFDESHIAQLYDMNIEQLTDMSRYMVLLQTGDETLDYREAEQRYAGSHMIIEHGGDHAFVDFENHIAEILAFSHISCD
jgi:predicted esterase YcpF (UPF0227 family)